MTTKKSTTSKASPKKAAPRKKAAAKRTTKKADAVSAAAKTVAKSVAASKAKKAISTKRSGHAPQSQLTLEETKKLEAARAKKAKQATPKVNGKLSAIDAAAKVLTETKKAMNCKELVEAMAAKGYWKTPGGKTPDRTLYASILREINAKGKDARFKKAERGQFALAGRA